MYYIEKGLVVGIPQETYVYVSYIHYAVHSMSVLLFVESIIEVCLWHMTMSGVNGAFMSAAAGGLYRGVYPPPTPAAALAAPRAWSFSPTFF